MLPYRGIVHRVKSKHKELHKITGLATLSSMVWKQRKARVVLFRNMGWVEFKFRIWIQKNFNHSNINSKLKIKDRVYESSLNIELILAKNNTSMYELTLKLKHKSKTQAKQCKNFLKNYHKLFMISRAHGKNMTPRN